MQMHGGAKQMDQMMLSASASIAQLLAWMQSSLKELLHVCTLISPKMLQKQTAACAKDGFDQFAKTMLHNLETTGSSNLPSKRQLVNSHTDPMKFFDAATLPQMPDQLDESHVEQSFALQHVAGFIDCNRKANGLCPKISVLAGDPDSGKATVMPLILVHAMS